MKKNTMKARRLFLILILGLLAACGAVSAPPSTVPVPSVPPVAQAAPTVLFPDGTFTVGMECAYPPYNWTQGDDSHGAVPIANRAGSYANGYDVQFAKRLAQANGWELEIISLPWESLTSALQAGTVDAVIAGQSMASVRADEVDVIGPYYYAAVVCLTAADSRYAHAQGVSALSGGRCTAQSGTVWYDCLSQIQGAQIQEAAGHPSDLLSALTAGTVDFICVDMPTALAMLRQAPDLILLDFTGSGDDFQFADEETRLDATTLALSVSKDNSALSDAIKTFLAGMDRSDFDALMGEVISFQPAAP